MPSHFLLPRHFICLLSTFKVLSKMPLQQLLRAWRMESCEALKQTNFAFNSFFSKILKPKEMNETPSEAPWRTLSMPIFFIGPALKVFNFEVFLKCFASDFCFYGSKASRKRAYWQYQNCQNVWWLEPVSRPSGSLVHWPINALHIYPAKWDLKCF